MDGWISWIKIFKFRVCFALLQNYWVLLCKNLHFVPKRQPPAELKNLHITCLCGAGASAAAVIAGGIVVAW